MTQHVKWLIVGLCAGGCLGLGAGFGIGAGCFHSKSTPTLQSGDARSEQLQRETPEPLSSGSSATRGRPVSYPDRKNGKLISFDEGVIDLGVVDQGATVTRAFVYRNRGDQVLKILETISSCGCTIADPSLREVPPGGSGVLKVTFRSGSFHGPINKTITVRTNDPVLPMAVLNVKAHIKTLFTLEPQVVNFGEVERGKLLRQIVAVKPVAGETLQIQRLMPYDPELKTEVLAQDPDANGVILIALSYTTQRNYGMFTSGTRLQIRRVGNKGAVPAVPLEVTIPIMGTVVGQMRVMPENIFFGTVQADVLFGQKKLIVTNKGGKPVEVRSVDTGYDGLKAAIHPLKPGAAYEIILTTEKAPPPGIFHRVMRVMTTESDAPIEVKLAGVVLKPTAATMQ